MNDDAQIARLDERLAGISASTALLYETAAKERGRLRDLVEEQRRHISLLETKQLIQGSELEKLALVSRADATQQISTKASQRELDALRQEFILIKERQASAAQVKVAIVGAGGAILAAAVALLKALF